MATATRLTTTADCDKELTELGKALKLVSRRSRPVVMKRIDQVLDLRHELGMTMETYLDAVESRLKGIGS